MSSLAETIKYLRNNSNYTVKELAAKMKKSESAYVRFEKSGNNAKLSDLISFAKIFDISVENLLNWPEKLIPESEVKKYVTPEVSIDTANEAEKYGKCLNCQEKDRTIKAQEIAIKSLQRQIEQMESFSASSQKSRSG